MLKVQVMFFVLYFSSVSACNDPSLHYKRYGSRMNNPALSKNYYAPQQAYQSMYPIQMNPKLRSFQPHQSFSNKISKRNFNPILPLLNSKNNMQESTKDNDDTRTRYVDVSLRINSAGPGTDIDDSFLAPSVRVNWDEEEQDYDPMDDVKFPEPVNDEDTLKKRYLAPYSSGYSNYGYGYGSLDGIDPYNGYGYNAYLPESHGYSR